MNEISDKVKALCNKVINTPLNYDGNFGGAANCAFCGARGNVCVDPEGRTVAHSKDCEVLIAKEILKEYE